MAVGELISSWYAIGGEPDKYVVCAGCQASSRRTDEGLEIGCRRGSYISPERPGEALADGT